MRWWQGILLYITMLYIGGPLFIIFPMPGGIYNDIVIRLATLVIAAIFLLPNPYACRTLFRLRRPLLGWTLAIAAGLTMVSQVTILVAFWTEPDMSGIVHPGAAWAQFLSIVILAPLSEELVLRGGIVTGLCEILPWLVTVALSGLLFAWGHSSFKALQALFAGVILGYLCWYTGSILYGVLIHMFINAFPGSQYMFALLEYSAVLGTAICLLLIAGGVALTLWGVRGFTRRADRLTA